MNKHKKLAEETLEWFPSEEPAKLAESLLLHIAEVEKLRDALKEIFADGSYNDIASDIAKKALKDSAERKGEL